MSLRLVGNPVPDHGSTDLNADATLIRQVLDETYRFVAVDVETANSDGSSICQLGLALATDDAQLHTISYFIDPEMHFAPFNTQLHGISAQTVQGHAIFPDVIATLRAFLQRHPLVQHSNFDKRAINGACQRYGLPDLDATWHDSVSIARRAWPELRGNGGHGLGNLKGFLGLDFEHHDAAEDAKAAAMVVWQAERQTGQPFTDLVSKPSPRTPAIAPTINPDGPLFGHVACFSGRFSAPRTKTVDLAAGAGIAVKTTMSRSVTLLVIGDRDLPIFADHQKSSKHRRADDLIAQGHSLHILSESEFRALLVQ